MSTAGRRPSSAVPGSSGLSLRQLASPLHAAIAELRGQIVEGELEPGEKILPEQLARQLGLSKAPVQEALRILEAGGEVVHRSHQGFSVVQLDQDELREIFRLRKLIENDVLRIAARKAGTGDLDRLAAAAAAISAVDRSDRLGQWSAEKQFFGVLFELAGSAREVRMIEQLWGPCAPYTARAIPELSLDDGSPGAIVSALRSGDTAAALKTLNERRKHVYDVLRLQVGR